MSTGGHQLAARTKLLRHLILPDAVGPGDKDDCMHLVRTSVMQEVPVLVEVVVDINLVLPVEMLERAFLLLPLRDLSSAVLVCRRWREVGEAPQLWRRLRLTVQDESLSYVQEALQLRRLQALSGITLNAVSQNLLQKLLKHRSLKELSMANINLSTMKLCFLFPLFRLVTSPSAVRLLGASLASLQATALFTALQESIQLKCLDLSVNNLSTVKPSLLVSVVSSLEEAKLVKTWLTTQQVSALFSQLGKCSRLKFLDLSHNNLSSVNPALLQTAPRHLTDLRLWGTHLSSAQVTALCSVLATGSTLMNIDLTGNKLDQVEPGLLVIAVTKLQKARLVRTSLTFEQVTALCGAIGESTRLKSLDLSLNNLSSVRSGLLASGVTGLEEVRIDPRCNYFLHLR